VRFDCKADNILALQEGLFGNAPRQWQTLDDVANEWGDNPIVVRPRTPGGKCWYEVTPIGWFLEYYKCGWFDPADYYFNEPIDNKSVTLNAEVTRSTGRLEMFYATEPMHMRPALREHGRHAHGLTALTILRHFACERGREVVEGLLDQFLGHVVEFTCMTKPYGTLGWKTVVWEVRNY